MCESIFLTVQPWSTPQLFPSSCPLCLMRVMMTSQWVCTLYVLVTIFTINCVSRISGTIVLLITCFIIKFFLHVELNPCLHHSHAVSLLQQFVPQFSRSLLKQANIYLCSTQIGLDWVGLIWLIIDFQVLTDNFSFISQITI